jgi:hypothetical protein
VEIMAVLGVLALDGFQEFLQPDHRLPKLAHLGPKRGIVGPKDGILGQSGSSFGLKGRYD